LVASRFFMNSSRVVNITVAKVFTPAAEIPNALRAAAAAEIERQNRQEGNASSAKYGPFIPRGGGMLTTIGGQQAFMLIADRQENLPDRSRQTYYIVWLQSENTLAEFSLHTAEFEIAVLRWQLDKALAQVHLP
jgi:hypothetical protein